jgi:hypothetical protein
MRRLSTSGTVPTIVPSGSTDVLRQIEDIIRGIQSDVGQVIIGYNEDVYPIISSFSQGRSETRWSLSDDIYPKKNGIDGSQVFLDNDASLSLEDGRYWRSDLSRPKTIKESVEDLYTSLSNSIDSIRGDFASVSSYGVPARAVGMIGDNIFDASKSSDSSSLDSIANGNVLHVLQVARDLYGDAYDSWTSDGSILLTGGSLRTMVEGLLSIHNSTWDSSTIPLHSALPIYSTYTGTPYNEVTALADDVIGGLIFDPSQNASVEVQYTFEAAIGYMGAAAVDGELYLYDMGTSGAIGAGTLVTTLSTASVAQGAGFVDKVSSILTISAAPIAGASQILNSERVYEIRTKLTGAPGPGEYCQVSWAGIVARPT